MDIERLKVDADYWLDKDPSNGESTHYEAIYDGHECAWVRVDRKGQRHYWLQGGWVNAEIYADEIGPVGSMIPRPTKTERSEDVSTEWVDGLPPRDCECEVRHETDVSKWFPCEILANHCGIVYRRLDTNDIGRSPQKECFRPIQTPEQRQREELAMVIDNALCSDNTPYHLADAILQWMKDKEK